MRAGTCARLFPTTRVLFLPVDPALTPPRAAVVVGVGVGMVVVLAVVVVVVVLVVVVVAVVVLMRWCRLWLCAGPTRTRTPGTKRWPSTPCSCL